MKSAFQRHRAGARAEVLRRPQGHLFDGYADDAAVRAAERAQYRVTRYETIAPLLDALPLPGGLWVEPCAGDGSLIRHVERWRAENGKIPVTLWHAVELRNVPALHEYGDSLGRRCEVFDGQDFTLWSPPQARHGVAASVVITNLPWYGWEPIIDHAFALYPHAHVVGHSCTREPLDNDRPDWHRAHPADLYVCNGRQVYGDGRAGYPHPVAWFHWPPGGRSRSVGAWRVLPRFDAPTHR